MLDHAISSCLAPFFNPPPYAEKVKKPTEYCNFLLILMTGIEPGPPAQKGTVLFITSSPLGQFFLLLKGSN